MRNDWYLKRVEAEKQCRITIVTSFRNAFVAYVALVTLGLAFLSSMTIDDSGKPLDIFILILIGTFIVAIIAAIVFCRFVSERIKAKESQKKLDDIIKFQQKFIEGEGENIKIEFENLKLYE